MKLREFFADSKRWSQGVSARTQSGEPTNYTWADAYSFCLLAAIMYFYPVEHKAILERVKAKKINSILKWNDAPERTIEDVLGLCVELDI